MDQNVIVTFKSYYLRRILNKLVQSDDSHRSCDGFDAENDLKIFWRNFDFRDSITFIEESWNNFKNSTLNACISKMFDQKLCQLKRSHEYKNGQKPQKTSFRQWKQLMVRNCTFSDLKVNMDCIRILFFQIISQFLKWKKVFFSANFEVFLCVSLW